MYACVHEGEFWMCFLNLTCLCIHLGTCPRNVLEAFRPSWSLCSVWDSGVHTVSSVPVSTPGPTPFLLQWPYLTTDCKGGPGFWSFHQVHLFCERRKEVTRMKQWPWLICPPLISSPLFTSLLLPPFLHTLTYFSCWPVFGNSAVAALRVKSGKWDMQENGAGSVTSWVLCRVAIVSITDSSKVIIV